MIKTIRFIEDKTQKEVKITYILEYNKVYIL